jgi:hypothetical protein
MEMPPKQRQLDNSVPAADVKLEAATAKGIWMPMVEVELADKSAKGTGPEEAAESAKAQDAAKLVGLLTILLLCSLQQREAAAQPAMQNCQWGAYKSRAVNELSTQWWGKAKQAFLKALGAIRNITSAAMAWAGKFVICRVHGVEEASGWISIDWQQHQPQKQTEAEDAGSGYRRQDASVGVSGVSRNGGTKMGFWHRKPEGMKQG